MAAQPEVRGVLERLAARRPVVWDPHPRGAEPVAGVRLATPNRAEAAGLVADVAGDGLPAVTAWAHALLARWSTSGVAVTLGARGALLVAADGTPLLVPAPAGAGGDACGAGDRFAARAASALARGLLVSEAVVEAVEAASAFVAAGGAGAIAGGVARPTTAAANGPAGRARPSALALAEQVRAARGTVVATGGCFDLLHAGHVQTLAAARRLGDCLIVCLNSDASVRRLKGPDRPLVPQNDRAAVLDALACVDAVAVFDEDTPTQILHRLRPDVWVKGADYAVGDLPEAALVASWAGQTVVLPYLPGRSTTRLIQEATHRDPR
ncbi:MAG TPA: D-glycero-beta-D-manno-heptose 1-phosphate adenylyltransferase [Egibacteraceae bacterium]|nr:D-glycero-beta-D-manno-heptose 1-phosphate adenylyltransferase [Egibacteraceae bacterium]